TDDETCKININTASEPTYWDTPMASSTPEANLGIFQATNNEFQRYPGHPATVALSPVLWHIFGTTTGPAGTGYVPPVTNSDTAYALPNSAKDLLYGMLPRVQAGGSVDGTTRFDGLPQGYTLPLDSDRLYASVDELAYSPNLTGGLATNVRPAFS